MHFCSRCHCNADAVCIRMFSRTCRYWDFGLVNVLTSMFQNPKFRRMYRTGRRYDDPTTYFGSPAFKAYDAAMNERVGENRPNHVPPTCMFQLGGDGVSLLNFGQRTATVIGVRCEELPGEVSQSHLAWRPIIVIEGPKETMVLHEILAATVRQLQAHAPMPTLGLFSYPCRRVSCVVTYETIGHLPTLVVIWFFFRHASIMQGILQVVHRTCPLPCLRIPSHRVTPSSVTLVSLDASVTHHSPQLLQTHVATHASRVASTVFSGGKRKMTSKIL